MPKITAADVAQAAGVSRAAVSRAFRQDGALAPDKRARIIAIAKELGYVSPADRAVGRLTNGTITLVVADLENPFYPAAANALSHAIHATGRRLVLHSVPPNEDVDSVLRQVLDYRSEAAIVLSSLMSSRLARECRSRKMPVILFNRIQPDARMTAVTCDNYGGGRLVAEQFLASGRKRIAMIGGTRNTSTHLERRRGFRDRLEEAGVRLSAELCGEYRYDIAYEAARTMLRAPAPPDAIFCLNDIMAFAALDAAREMKVSVPDALAVIGFDDVPMADWPPYRLTTVRQPLNRMIRDTLELIDAQLENPDLDGAIRIAPVRLIRRESA